MDVVEGELRFDKVRFKFGLLRNTGCLVIEADEAADAAGLLRIERNIGFVSKASTRKVGDVYG